jgi:hypothetical protein
MDCIDQNGESIFNNKNMIKLTRDKNKINKKLNEVVKKLSI